MSVAMVQFVSNSKQMQMCNDSSYSCRCFWSFRQKLVLRNSWKFCKPLYAMKCHQNIHHPYPIGKPSWKLSWRRFEMFSWSFIFDSIWYLFLSYKLVAYFQLDEQKAEICDELYEEYTALFSGSSPEDSCFKTYFVVSSWSCQVQQPSLFLHHQRYFFYPSGR